MSGDANFLMAKQLFHSHCVLLLVYAAMSADWMPKPAKETVLHALSGENLADSTSLVGTRPEKCDWMRT